MRKVWAGGVASVGLLLVGVVYGCIWYAIPDRPAARDWPVYGPLLLGPYALAAFGCGLSVGRLVRVLAVLTVLAGGLIAAVAVCDAWQTFGGGPPPAMPASVLASVVLLMAQYWAGIIAAVGGLAGRSAPDAEPGAAVDRGRKAGPGH